MSNAEFTEINTGGIDALREMAELRTVAAQLYLELRYATRSIHGTMHERDYTGDKSLNVPLLDCPHENCIKRLKLLAEYQASGPRPATDTESNVVYSPEVNQVYELFLELEHDGIFDSEITPAVQTAIKNRIVRIFEAKALRDKWRDS